MTTATTMERMLTDMGTSAMTAPIMPGMMTSAPNMMMVPHCTFDMMIKCDDAMACRMIQNLYRMLAGGMMCYMMMNRMIRFPYNIDRI